MIDDGDVLDAIIAGRFVDPEHGTRFHCPIGRLVVAESLDGEEAALVAGLRLGRRIAVVADEATWDILGGRVARAIGAATTVVLKKPPADAEQAEEIRRRTRDAEALVAVGSGTVSDLCKLAAHRDRRRYACFPTAPTSVGYVTATACLQQRGVRVSLPARPPAGLFVDLAVLRQAPARLIRAGIGCCLARSVSQVDSLLAHHLQGAPHADTPFDLALGEEGDLIELAHQDGLDPAAAVPLLVRLLLLLGLGEAMAPSGTSGSAGPHLVSHYVDSLAMPRPGCLHGEQLGVASLSLARLQGEILARQEPPVVEPTWIDEEMLHARFGPIAEDCIKALKRKALDRQAADQLNSRLASDWPRLRAKLRGAAVPVAKLERLQRELGLPSTAAEVGIPADFYREAVVNARALRDRYGILDLAGDAGLLELFAAGQG
ncbi:MAG: iron-containing alcohol dehydrogenase [Geminicoccaceae bacterium]